MQWINFTVYIILIWYTQICMRWLLHSTRNKHRMCRCYLLPWLLQSSYNNRYLLDIFSYLAAMICPENWLVEKQAFILLPKQQFIIHVCIVALTRMFIVIATMLIKTTINGNTNACIIHITLILFFTYIKL